MTLQANIKRLEKAIKIVRNILYVVLSIFILLVIWEIVALCVNNELLLPTFGQACADLWDTLKSSTFYESMGYTILRTLLSFVIAIVIAVGLFFFAKVSNFTRTFVQSIVSTLRSLPTIALILFLLILTNSQIAPSIICVLVVMPIIYAGLQGLQIDEPTKNMCRIYKIQGVDYFKFVYFPKMQNVLLPVLSSSIALNLKVMVASEVLAHTYMSLGGLMQSASVYFEMGQLLALAFITVIIAIVLEKLINLLKYIHFKC